MPEDFSEASLKYHRKLPYGKLEVVATKPLANQRDLSLAYSPGVAAACTEIADNPAEVATLTSRGNLVGVISNGTAVLGLGNIGPLAAKPVMEGKAVLFKKFAGVDVFDIEVNEEDPEKLIEIIRSLEPTFGGINLEDITAPTCFIVEKALKEQMNIPVFHDDQHGTAIIVAAAVRNALHFTGKDIEKVTIAASGAGAASLACLDLLIHMGVKRENITVADSKGVINTARKATMDEYKGAYAQDTDAQTLAEIMVGADIFLGLSVAGLVTPDMVEKMADSPIIMALANPTPEILPELALEVRPDAILATGRSDYPNQVNNVLCFPYLFRGALDVGATGINMAMKVAAVDAIADLAKRPPTEEVDRAYGGISGIFGPENLIPKPFDSRLILEIAPAVAKAAMDSGIATRPIEDFEAYGLRLSEFVHRSGSMMKPIIDQAQSDPQRVVFAEGERRKTLQAAQQVVSMTIAFPILIGRRKMILHQIDRLGLKLKEDIDYEIVDPMDNSYFKVCWSEYHALMGRHGISPKVAKHVVTTNTTVLGSLLVRLCFADAMLAGTVGPFDKHIEVVHQVAGVDSGVNKLSSMMVLFLPTGTLFMSDTHVQLRPTPEDLAEIALQASKEVSRFGITPKVAMLSRSNFGNHPGARSSSKIKKALEIVRELAPDLEIDGEMHGDAAMSQEIRDDSFPKSILRGRANTLIFPRGDASHISYNLLKMLGGGVSVGPILMGCALPIHVLTNSASVRGIVNMTAVAVADAQIQERCLVDV